MRMDWVPGSAALLVMGVMALSVGSVLSPSGGSAAETLRLVEEQDGRWLAVAVIYFLASAALMLGLPAVLTLFERRGRKLGLLSATVLAIGFLGIAGYAMLLVFFRALVITDAIREEALERAVGETGLTVFLFGWVVAFYLGELLLAVALLIAGSVPQWVPALLVLHVLLLPLTSVLPDAVSSYSVLVMAGAFAAIGIRAASPERRTA